MARFFSPELVEALSQTVVRVGWSYKFEFVSKTIYAWDGNTELVAGGNTYQPLYGAASMDGLGLGAQGTVSESVALGLHGLPLPPDFLAQVLAETPEAFQQMLTVSMHLFDDEWQPKGPPVPLFCGFMQPPSATRSEATGTDGAVQSVSITAENIFYGRSRPPYGRYTDTDQQRRSPGDKFFAFTPSLRAKQFTYPDY